MAATASLDSSCLQPHPGAQVDGGWSLPADLQGHPIPMGNPEHSRKTTQARATMHAERRASENRISARQAQQRLRALADPDQAAILARFFKTGPGEHSSNAQECPAIFDIIEEMRAKGSRHGG